MSLFTEIRTMFPDWWRVGFGLLLVFGAAFAAAAHAPSDVTGMLVMVTIAAAGLGVVPPIPASITLKPLPAFILTVVSIALGWFVNANSLGFDLSQTWQAVIVGVLAVLNVFVTPPPAKSSNEVVNV